MAYFTKLLKLTRLQARLPIANQDGTGTTAFVDNYNRMQINIENSANDQTELLNQIAEILDIQRKQAGDIDDIRRMTSAQGAEQALVNSYTDPTAVLAASTQSATQSTVVVQSHARIYADEAKTTVQVVGKTFTTLLPETYYFFYYDDPTRAGGEVDIKYSTNNLDAAQTGVRHSLGGIVTPAVGSGPIDGGGTTPPGGGGYNPRQPTLQQPDDQ